MLRNLVTRGRGAIPLPEYGFVRHAYALKRIYSFRLLRDVAEAQRKGNIKKSCHV